MPSQAQLLAAIFRETGFFRPYSVLTSDFSMSPQQRKQVAKRRKARKNQKLAAKRNRSR